MILGALKARSQRAFNAPNPIDFLSLKPEKIAAKPRVQPKLTDYTIYQEISLIIKKHNYIAVRRET